MKLASKRLPPEIVEIELINVCNLRCEICERGNPSYIQKPIKIMTFGNFKKIIDTYNYPINRIQFCGTSEPLLNPDLPKMINYVKIKKKPKKIELITNATLLSKQISKNLIKSGLNLLEASVDGPDTRTYEKIRHFNFKKLTDNLKNFKKLAKKKVHFGINCVVNSLNYNSLIKMPSFAKEVGADTIEFRIYETNLLNLKSLAIHDKKKLEFLKDKILKKCKNLKINCDFWNIDEIQNEKCNLETEANINSESSLTPCYHLPNLVIQKLGKDKFSKIWKGKKVSALLSKINKNKFLDECSCFMAISKK